MPKPVRYMSFLGRTLRYDFRFFFLHISPLARTDTGALDKQFRDTSECGSLSAYAGEYARSGGPL